MNQSWCFYHRRSVSEAQIQRRGRGPLHEPSKELGYSGRTFVVEPDEPDPDLMKADTDPPQEMGPAEAGDVSDADMDKASELKMAAAEARMSGKPNAIPSSPSKQASSSTPRATAAMREARCTV